MGFHTFDPAETDKLDDPTRFRLCSREELLGALPDGGTLLDLGSGTGFYTDELAPFFERVVAFDLQPAMHQQYRERGMPPTVRPVIGDAAALPFADGAVDAAISTMTFHESASDESARDLHRVLAGDGALVIVDWSAEGRGESGPPRSQRFSLAGASDMLRDVGFAVDAAAERGETFFVRATP